MRQINSVVFRSVRSVHFARVLVIKDAPACQVAVSNALGACFFQATNRNADNIGSADAPVVPFKLVGDAAHLFSEGL